jgi:hypothetical protein
MYQREGACRYEKVTTYRILNIQVLVSHHQFYRYPDLWVRSEIEVAARYAVVITLEPYVQPFQSGIRLENLLERGFCSARSVD